MSRKPRLLAIVLLASSLLLGSAPQVGASSLVDVGETAVVATTEGNLLSLRDGPGLDATILIGLGAGTEVMVLDGPVYADDIAWYKVSGAGLVGWCAGEWLASPSSGGEVRYIGGSEGAGVWLRDEPGFGGERMLLIPDGGATALMGAATYVDGIDWALVSYGGTVGWVAAGFLNGVPSGQGGGAIATYTSPRGQDLPPSAVGIIVGERAVVTGTDGQDVRIRDGIGTDAPIFSFVPEGRVVLIVNGPMYDGGGNAWYGIDYDGIQGWVFGGYLSQTVAALSARTGAGVYDPARGEAIVMEAMQHLGTPYVWGGDGPLGWDCSGMVQWLYDTVAGIELPRVSQDQFFVGTPLRQDEIQPGDIVFFADTDGPGITHNGIAIGGGLFLHARDESRGTTISSLYEPLWVQHYAGARRP
ncbi:MAG: C40 family peptidase [Chloroflexia bacterium]